MPWVDRTAALKEESGYRAEMRLSQKVVEKNLVGRVKTDGVKTCLPIYYVMSEK